jgi:hypothetical protein
VRSPARRDYLAALALYRQRAWSCKYTGAAGLTYEEAVASEHRVDSVVRQVGVVGRPQLLELLLTLAEAAGAGAAAAACSSA